MAVWWAPSEGSSCCGVRRTRKAHSANVRGGEKDTLELTALKGTDETATPTATPHHTPQPTQTTAQYI